MYKFSVGDTVFISECSDSILEMQEFVGTYVTIEGQTNGIWSGQSYRAYYIKEDCCKWYWREDWLKPATDISVTEEELINILEEE